MTTDLAVGRFPGLVRAELLRARGSRAVVVVAGVAFAVTVLTTLALGSAERIGTIEREWAAVAGSAAPFLLVLAALEASSELRHGGLAPAVTAGVGRTQLHLAKVTGNVVVAAAVVAACVVGAVAAGAAGVEELGGPGDLLRPEQRVVLLGGAVSAVLMTVIGVAVGTIVRNGAGAVAVALGWFAIVENAVAAALGDGVAKLLPGKASAALIEAAAVPEHAGRAAGGLTLLAYALVLSVAAVATLRSRDL